MRLKTDVRVSPPMYVYGFHLVVHATESPLLFSDYRVLQTIQCSLSSLARWRGVFAGPLLPTVRSVPQPQEATVPIKYVITLTMLPARSPRR